MMTKARKGRGGVSYVAHRDVLAEQMKNAAFRAAYLERRYVQEIARTVRSIRESAGLSQAELGKMVGMKQPAIARLETSQGSTPQWRTLTRIALALGKQLSFKLGDVDSTKPLVHVHSARKSRERDAPAQ